MTQNSNQVVGVRAIDVGYFNVKYTKGRKMLGDSSVIDVGMFPSLAPQAAAAPLIARGPSANTCTVHVKGMNYVVGPGAKFHTSASEPRPIDPNYSETDKYYALSLGALHYMAEDAGAGMVFEIDLLVVGLPLHNYQRHWTKLAARMQGEHKLSRSECEVVRTVRVNKVHVMVQPHGALCHFGAVRQTLDGWNLVVDPGGGTLDWFMADGQQPNWKRSGAYSKAMLQCAYAVADSIDQGAGWRNQFEIVDAIDLAIRTNAHTFTVGTREFELAKYRPAIEAVLQESVKSMLETTGPLDAVKRIVFTGGGASVFRDYMARTMPGLEPAMDIDTDPVFSNVRGFQTTGEVLRRIHTS